jgi:hypothetical protein
MEKLGANDRTQAIMIAARGGIIHSRLFRHVHPQGVSSSLAPRRYETAANGRLSKTFM